MTAKTTVKTNQPETKQAQERREREEATVLAKHLHPPVTTAFKSSTGVIIRF